MANDEHLEILKQGGEKWNQWHKEHSEIQPDLSEADLRGADLTGANLTWVSYTSATLRLISPYGADFSRANLSEAYLNRAELYGANLSEANLNRASLWRADLNFADLSFADLSGANLYGADLSGANLTGAKLIKADLTKADLSFADLTGANLSEAKISWTIFGDIDLRSVKGLDNVVHNGSSIIGTGTLYESGGKVPEGFLRGCGVPENFITYIGSLVGKPIEFYSCFISYSHADKPFARRLYDQLQMRGIRCWLDEKQMLPGDDIYEHVDRGIRLWDKVLLCASRHSLTSW